MNGASYTLPLRLSSGHDKATGTRVDIEHMEIHKVKEDVWIPLKEWLLEMFDRSTNEYRDDWAFEQKNFRGYMWEEQSIWWKYNGLHFRLLDLPAEIRNMVYFFTIGHIVILRPNSLGNICLGTGSPQIKPEARVFVCHPHDDPPVDPPNTSLFYVNRQVSAEARAVAWTEVMKRFQWTSPPCTSLSAATISSLTVRNGPAALSHIQLELSAAQYFAFIGIVPTFEQPFGAGISDLHVNTLAQIPSVAHLDIRFISPNRPDAKDPWADVHRPWDNRMRPIPRHSCQKIWIEWFLTFLLKDLRRLGHIKRVTLSGCVKNSTQKIWKKIFDDEVRKGTKVLNLDEEIWNIIEQNPWCEPIRCRCTNNCCSTASSSRDGVPTEVEKFDHND
jgi:hypothetical protein